MSRLIDADELKANMEHGEIIIDEYVLKCETMHDMLLYLLKKVEDCMVSIIDSQPTAHSVEAVVRELEQEIKYHAKAQLRCEDKGFEEGADRHRQQVIAFDTAIAIVKRGGRNE